MFMRLSFTWEYKPNLGHLVISAETGRSCARSVSVQANRGDTEEASSGKVGWCTRENKCICSIHAHLHPFVRNRKWDKRSLVFLIVHSCGVEFQWRWALSFWSGKGVLLNIPSDISYFVLLWLSLREAHIPYCMCHIIFTYKKKTDLEKSHVIVHHTSKQCDSKVALVLRELTISQWLIP